MSDLDATTKETDVKVKDLIAQLQQMDPNARVVVDGYEGGATERVTVAEVKLALNQNSEWFYGEHDVSSSGRAKAVLLSRNGAAS